MATSWRHSLSRIQFSKLAQLIIPYFSMACNHDVTQTIYCECVRARDGPLFFFMSSSCSSDSCLEQSLESSHLIEGDSPGLAMVCAVSPPTVLHTCTSLGCKQMEKGLHTHTESDTSITWSRKVPIEHCIPLVCLVL